MMSAKTVLIIEDDDVLVSVIEELLKFDGLNVRIARNAAAGIQLSTAILPDLILMLLANRRRMDFEGE